MDVLSRVREILCSENLDFIVKDTYNGFMIKKRPRLLGETMHSPGYKVEYAEMTSWTDEVNLHEMAGCDTAIFGPGKLHACHTKWEKTKRDKRR